jgi:hypothetical protein
MTSKFTELAIDGADPNGLARFWCSVLDYEVAQVEQLPASMIIRGEEDRHAIHR